MVEGKATGDGRYVEPGAIRWDAANMPYPLTWNRQGGGHDDRVVVGSIDTLIRDDAGLIRGEGVLLTGVVPEADMVVPLIERGLVGLSAELDDETAVLQPVDADGNPVGDPESPMGIMIGAANDIPDVGEQDAVGPNDLLPEEVPAEPTDMVDMQYRVTDARIRNAAIVDTPAFIDCTIELVGDELPADSPGIVAALHAAANFAQEHTSAMVAFLPADPEGLAVDGGLAPAELHVTAGFYGPTEDLTDQQMEALGQLARDYAATTGPITARVSGHGTIGDDDPAADVLMVEAPEFEALRTQLASNGPPLVLNHPHFTPHMTLGYGLDHDLLAAARDATGELTFDRLLVALGEDRTEYPLEGDMGKKAALVAGAVGTHQTGTDTGAWDAAAEEAKLPTPLTLDQVKAAYAWYDEAAADADGTYPKTAAKFIHHFVDAQGAGGAASTVACSAAIGVLHGGRGGTSIPDSDVQGVYDHVAKHLRDAGQEPPALSSVLAGATCVACSSGQPCDVARTFAIPAEVAAEARRFQGWKRAGKSGGSPTASARAASLARGGTVTYAQLRRLLLGLARLESRRFDSGWESGDRGYPTPGRVAWAAHGGDGALEWARPIIEGLEGPVQTYAGLTAASHPAPKAAYFADPGLQGPTPWTVDGDRVYGHLATWDTCHISVSGTCLSPPRSSAGYANFHQGAPFRLDDGTVVRAGKVTFGANHADKQLAFGPTIEHYENTGHVAADVVAGEDRYGIWVAGQLRPGLTADQRLAIERTSISGDWRAVNGRLELMAALCVNNPGFPVVQSVAASGRQRTLIVAGAVEADLADRARRGTGHDPRLEAAAEALAATIGRDRPSLVAAMTTEVHG